MLRVFNLDAYALLDPGANWLFVTIFLVNKFHAHPDVLHDPYGVSNLVGESIFAQRIYENYPIFILNKMVSFDLVELSIVYFDVILSMKLFHASYASVD